MGKKIPNIHLSKKQVKIDNLLSNTTIAAAIGGAVVGNAIGLGGAIAGGIAGAIIGSGILHKS